MFNMTQNVVIYGDSDFAEQIYYQLETDERYKILAFTVDKSRYQKKIFKNIPVIPFQDLSNYYSSERICIFPAVGYSRLNKIRENVISEIQAEGFRLLTYISKNAVINESAKIDEGSYICEFVSIGANTKIGVSTIILPHSSIAHDVTISNFTFLSHSVTIGGKSCIKSYSFLGLGCIVQNDITIEECNIIGSGANVIKSTKFNGVYAGNPAKLIKNVDFNNLGI